MSTPTDALILTAGLGTRLRPLTGVRAKPAIPVAGEPMARRIIRWLAAAGVTRVTLNLHHLPQTIAAVVGDGSDLGAEVRYSWEQPAVLGSAGGPRQALDIVGADEFLLVNGDTLTDLAVDRVWNAHRGSGALVTLALVPNLEPHRYGGVQLSPAGEVTGFVRSGPAAEGSYHFIGVQAVSRRAFDAISRGAVAPSIGGLYDQLIASRPGCVRGLVAEATFWDVGTIADYWRTSMAFAPGGQSTSRTGVHVSPSAQVTRSILWDDISIGDHAVVDECIVTDGVRLPGGSVHARAILTRGAGDRVESTPLALGLT